MVSGNFELPLCVCDQSHSSARAVHQCQVKNLGHNTVVHLVVVPPFSVLVVSGDTFHGSPA